jgi:hypothetical protein
MVSCSTWQVIIFKRQTHPLKTERTQMMRQQTRGRGGQATHVISALNDRLSRLDIMNATEQIGLVVMFWTCIREVFISNFGLDIVYPD